MQQPPICSTSNLIKPEKYLLFFSLNDGSSPNFYQGSKVPSVHPTKLFFLNHPGHDSMDSGPPAAEQVASGLLFLELHML